MTSVCAQWMEDICLLTLQLHNPLGSEPAQKSRKAELMSAFSLDRSQSKSYIFTDTVGKMWVFGKVVAKVTGSKSLRLIRLLMHTLPKVKSAVSCLIPYTPLTQIPRLCGVEVWYSKGCLYLRARFDIFIPKILEISHFCLLNAFGSVASPAILKSIMTSRDERFCPELDLTSCEPVLSTHRQIRDCSRSNNSRKIKCAPLAGIFKV